MKKIIRFITLIAVVSAMLITLFAPAAVFADPKATAPRFRLGNVDGDDSVTSADARLALRASVGLEKYDPFSYAASAADVDRDNSISSADARLILRNSVGLEELPQGARESCDLFTVTVPGEWEGNYEVEKTENILRFFCLPARQNGSNGFLFNICVYPDAEAAQEWDISQFAYLLTGGEKPLYVTVEFPSDLQIPKEAEALYNRMSENAAAIVGTLEPAQYNLFPEIPDYSGLTGNYSGTDGTGDMYYAMTVRNVEHNVLDAAVSYNSPSGEGNVTVDVTVSLFGDSGSLWWTDGKEYYVGTASVQNGNVLLALNGPKGSWADTENPVTFYPMTTEITESCDFFTVALPSDWEGKYLCETESDRIVFRHKASVDAGAEGMLFSLTAFPIPDNLNEAGLGGDCAIRFPLAMDVGDDVYYLMVVIPNIEQTVPSCESEYNDMVAYADEIIGHITPASANVIIRPVNFSSLLQKYEGKTDSGERYVLNVFSCVENELGAEIEYYAPGSNDPSTMIADIVMFENQGLINWDLPEIIVGGGTITVSQDELLFSLYPIDGSEHFNTYGPIVLRPAGK